MGRVHDLLGDGDLGGAGPRREVAWAGTRSGRRCRLAIEQMSTAVDGCKELARSFVSGVRGLSQLPRMDMAPFNEDNLPDDLQDVARRLREERREATPLELDRIKMDAMSRARSRSFVPRGGLRSRLVVALTSLALVGGATG